MKTTSAKILLNELAETLRNVEISQVVTDSRMVSKGSVFVAIKGEKVDGNDFARAAVENGAEYVISQKNIEGIDEKHLIIVDSVLDALIKMAANYIALFDLLVFAITGSAGKTTTKEFLACILQQFGTTIATQGNQNNEIGMPNTIFKIDDDTKFVVLEMGMSAIGDIKKLSQAAKPDVAIITNIGSAHIELLGTKENILEAKLEICDGLKSGGIAVVNGDDNLLNAKHLAKGLSKVNIGLDNRFVQVQAIDVHSSPEGERFTIQDKQLGDYTITIPAVGKHNILNALLAYTAATRAGFDAKISANALEKYAPCGMRQNVVQFEGLTIIEDCYNANPDSMKAGIEALSLLGKGKRKIAVVGDMLELGEYSAKYHNAVGKQLANGAVTEVIGYGDAIKETVKQAKESGVENAQYTNIVQDAVIMLLETVQKGDTILFKASRGIKLENVLSEFYKTYNGADND